ncbi:MAG: zinc ribbon domain-containing protein [Lachnospiraceae bacterium]|nr:zinc ribbon domain-containing protein [Lachnospiraceae bacterium]
MEQKGYITLTYRMRFYDKHLDWLSNTVDLYNKVIKYYYNLLAEKPELLDMSNFNLMRELEVMTIGNKEMKKNGENIPYPLLNLPTIPLYFRRAAINYAIGITRSFYSQKEKEELQLKERKISPSLASNFSAAPVYYKGMYKEWKENSIMLKVYTGEKWIWKDYRFCGRALPKDAQKLSPSIYVEKKQAYLHIPVKKTVGDIQLVKERMQTEEVILAVSFPGNDSIAVGAVMTRAGLFQKAVFFRGGSEMKAKKNALKRKLKKAKKEQKQGEHFRRKIENINDYYAHLISKRIVEYCIKENIRVIAVPNYQQTIDFSQKQYLKTDHFEWIGRRVIRYLKYKAFSAGILVSAVPVAHVSDCCSECGSKIRRYNEGHTPGIHYFGGQLFLCPNGHRGNSGLNTAKNIGKRFLSYY